ncbi:melanoma inhibitory activity protein 2-like isoform X1 [Saimiri boliviensis]|uniref:melanoma inhibitory activity protein 2-like isoform X1 n=1 Tax=Saimiri boliviensis TaxID=27679 RepID=UPI003D77106D
MVSNSTGFPWELVIWAGVIGFVAIPLFLWRSCRSVRSRQYVGREKKLAVELSKQIKEKCKLLEKLSFLQKSYEDYERESSFQDVSFEKEAAEAQSLETTCEKLNRSISEMRDEILYLTRELKEEKYKNSTQHQLRHYKTFTVEENCQLKRQEKLSKQDKNINSTTDQLDKYRKQAQHLEKELERMILSYQEQILLLKKKAHDKWLAARSAEINLKGLRKENAKYRQKLADTERKFKFLHKAPSAVGVPNTGLGRECYTNVTDTRRGTPFPPPPPGTLFGVSPHDFPPSDFPGPPYAPFAVRNAYLPTGFPPNLPPRPGFFPPTPKY